MKLITDIAQHHRRTYGPEDVMIKSPGRANIIGEHTDYNDGFVLPFAIDKAIYMLVNKSKTNSSEIHAYNINQTESFTDKNETSFCRYFSAVIQSFKNRSLSVSSYNVTFGGDLPIGAGVSSSSAISCGFVAAINEIEAHDLSKIEMLEIAVEAERGVGVEGGIMDQFSIINGISAFALCLDCRDNSWSEIPCKLGNYTFCLINTGVEHNLAETEYNTRARTCAEALRMIMDRDGEVSGFRDISFNHLSYLELPHRNRVEHVITENHRVMEAIQALETDDIIALGEILSASHVSLRDKYEVSCPESDYIVDYLSGQEYAMGSRMMGGGFGGSVIAIIKTEQLDKTIEPLTELYKQKFEKEIHYFPVSPEQGLTVVTV